MRADETAVNAHGRVNLLHFGGGAGRHISFGKGVHFCLGARLAKFEVRTVTEILSQRLPCLRLVEGQDLDYFPNITFRGPTELHVAWT